MIFVFAVKVEKGNLPKTILHTRVDSGKQQFQ